MFKFKLDHLHHQSILILGLGREGLSTYKFLRQHLPQKKLTLADQHSLSSLDKNTQTLIQQDNNLALNLGQNYLTNLNKYKLIFKTPGIPQSLPQIQQALVNGSRLSSNTQLFFDLVYQELPTLTPTIIGVTGTKGKSTTAALIHHVLNSNHHHSLLIGNIGIPPLSLIDQIQSNTKIVIELSSHQLSNLTLSPQIAVIQEITAEHLDYYHDVNEYVLAKSAITRYQTNDKYKVIYNPNFPKTQQLAKLSVGEHLKHGLEAKNDLQVYIKNDCITFNNNATKIEEPIINVKEVPLLGQHNLYNIFPAVIIAKLFKLSNQKIATAIKSFKGLAHRLELVAEIQGIKYYNDSLATTPEAASFALHSVATRLNANKKIILIAGGYERHLDYHHLADQICQMPIRALILFPTTGQRIWDDILNSPNYQALSDVAKQELQAHFVNTMPAALNIAQTVAQTGDVVLMSPAAASFGLFKDYQDRGEQFKLVVSKLAK